MKKANNQATNIEQKINLLRQEIAKHDILYHQHDAPIITDQDYDLLKIQLIKLEEEFPILQTTDSPSQSLVGFQGNKFNKVKHIKPMLSLNNAFSLEEVEAFLERIKRLLDAPFPPLLTCEPKIDGLSCAIYYKGGKLAYALTRGDGVYGEDVTHNVKTIACIPAQVSLAQDFEVRGEIYMSKEHFLNLNDERHNADEPLFANPRNAAAGSLRQLDPEVTRMRPLRYLAWGGEVPGITSQAQLIQTLSSLGFQIAHNMSLCTTIEEIKDYYAKLEATRHELEYDIDGLVYKIDSIDLQECLGYTSKAPRWAIAHKFSAEVATSKIEDIVIQVGRTGALTPVAIFKPVNIGGVLVTRASLHNEEELRRKGVRIGDTVVVKRAGDVIPQIVGVDLSARPADSVEYAFPSACPICGSPIEKEDAAKAVQRCTGSAVCRAQIIEYLKYFASKAAFNIEGLGEKQLEELYTTGKIQTPADIFRLEEAEKALEQAQNDQALVNRAGWGRKSVDSLFTSISRSSSIELNKFIYSLGIRYIGATSAKVIAEHFRSFEQFFLSVTGKALPYFPASNIGNCDSSGAQQELEQINGIGDVIVKEIIKFFANPLNLAFIADILQYVNIKAEGPRACLESVQAHSTLYNKSIVFTGTLKKTSREQAQRLAESCGARIYSSISSKTDYLVTGQNAGSKIEKAKKLGIRILTELEFYELVPNSIHSLTHKLGKASGDTTKLGHLHTVS